MRNPFKKVKASQEITVLTPLGTAEHRVLVANGLCCSDNAKYQGWELEYPQQSKDENTGVMVQFVSSTNKKPLKIFKDRQSLQTQVTSKLAGQSFDAKLTQVTGAKQRQSQLIWLGIAMTSLMLIIALIILLNMG